MTANELLLDIASRKEQLGLTNQMIAEASGVPKSSVDRLLRGETSDPRADAVLNMAYVVGYHLVNDNDEQDTDKLVNMLERESRLKTVQSNSLIAAKDRTIEDKSRWVKFLTIATIAFASALVLTWAGIALLLHYDMTHIDVGYFRR